MWPGRFTNVTNGVTHRRWLMYANPLLSELITDTIGSAWKSDFSQIQKLSAYAGESDVQLRFLEVKKACKTRLLRFLQREVSFRNGAGVSVPLQLSVDESFLFDVQAKRIHEYKRQLLNALHLIMLYHEILDGKPRVKRFSIFAGKAAASYTRAKAIIRLINAIARKVNGDPVCNKVLGVCYVENYNVSKAEYLMPAADLSEQISTAGMEASGTGNMKFAINGALTIGTEDGANIEMREKIGDRWWPFRFGASSEELADLSLSRLYDPREIYRSDPAIARAVDALRDGSFAVNDEEHRLFCSLYHSLLEGEYGEGADRFFVLKDIQAYKQMQSQVEQLYVDPKVWAEFSLCNIAGMGSFSSDRSIEEYCQKIWQTEPMDLNHEFYARTRAMYEEIGLKDMGVTCP